MNKRIENIVIIGGGSAGWMAATAISKILARTVKVTLIESEEIGTVGVGEATIPALRQFHKLLGLEESDFLRCTYGSYKLGIEFENWGAIGDRYMHPFGLIGKDCWAASFHHFWVKYHKNGGDKKLGDFSLDQQAAYSGKFANHPKTGLDYAYHFDATKYAKMLRMISEKQNVKRTEGKVSHVTLDNSNGFISSVSLESGEKIEGDLFVDCTGFFGLLIDKTLKTGYEDWTHWLPCNRAIAVQTESVEPAKPYTRAIAHQAGWRWRIPLQHRVGNGIVYCNNFLDDDTARNQLVKDVDGELVNEPRLLKFTTGRRLKQWNKNCVSLGLASGFLEPLESTSLHLVQSGIIRLLKLFPYDGIRKSEVDEYNKQSKIEFEGIRDFIIMHYHATTRDDSDFWNHCRLMEVPDTLQSKLELFKEGARIFRERDELFLDGSWSRVMIGQRIIPESYHPIVDELPEKDFNLLFENVAKHNNQILESLPQHIEFINKYCKAG